LPFVASWRRCVRMLFDETDSNSSTRTPDPNRHQWQSRIGLPTPSARLIFPLNRLKLQPAT
jgi:hypothetical protein